MSRLALSPEPVRTALVQDGADVPVPAPTPCLLDEWQAAGLLNCSVAYLRRGRLFRNGPQFVKLGRLVRYRMQDLDAFISAGIRAASG
jgi:hypothetical protein